MASPLDGALYALQAPVEARAAGTAEALVYAGCPEQLAKSVENGLIVEAPPASVVRSRLFSCERPRDVCRFLEETQGEVGGVEKARQALLGTVAKCVKRHGCGAFRARAVGPRRGRRHPRNRGDRRAHPARGRPGRGTRGRHAREGECA